MNKQRKVNKNKIAWLCWLSRQSEKIAQSYSWPEMTCFKKLGSGMFPSNTNFPSNTENRFLTWFHFPPYIFSLSCLKIICDTTINKIHTETVPIHLYKLIISHLVLEDGVGRKKLKHEYLLFEVRCQRSDSILLIGTCMIDSLAMFNLAEPHTIVVN